MRSLAFRLSLALSLISTQIFAAKPVTTIADAKDCKAIIESAESLREKVALDLSAQEKKAVAKLAKGSYVVEVERINVGGQDRLIILTGESAKKTEKDVKRFGEMMELFTHHAVEGADVSNFWFPKQMAKKFDEKGEVRKIEKAYKEDMEKDLAKALAQKIAAGGTNLKNEIAKLPALLVDMKRNLENEQDSSDKGVEVVRSTLDLVDVKAIEAQITANLESKTESSKDPESEKSPDQVANQIMLEKGYQPSLLQKTLAAAYLARGMSTKACIAKGVCLAGLAFVAPHAALVGAVGLGFGAAGTMLTGFIAPKVINDPNRRNEFMASNLEKVLKENPEMQKIVVSVDAKHVPGLLALLREQGSQPVGWNR